jgi:small conductance mechanosensitive channel
VKSISLLYTRIVTRDNRLVYVPNGLLMDDNIVNCTAMGDRRVDLVVGIAYDADIQKAREVIMEVLKEDERVMEEPEPVVKVLELGGSSVNLGVRPWVDSNDYMPVKLTLYEKIKDALDAADIGIPFPQRDVHLFQEEADESGDASEESGQDSHSDDSSRFG